jgi:secondary thiamine-phosphate synthase enzyme
MVIKKIDIRTTARNELIDITTFIEKVVREAEISEGVCVLFVPHTTAAVTINENADPSVRVDIITSLNTLAPAGNRYQHREGNADAHIKASLIGPSESILVKSGRLLLGTWQGIFFCEFDGPRARKIWVRLI